MKKTVPYSLVWMTSRNLIQSDEKFSLGAGKPAPTPGPGYVGLTGPDRSVLNGFPILSDGSELKIIELARIPGPIKQDKSYHPPFKQCVGSLYTEKV